MLALPPIPVNQEGYVLPTMLPKVLIVATGLSVTEQKFVRAARASFQAILAFIPLFAMRYLIAA